jgi:GcrA cell cycle regulator
MPTKGYRSVWTAERETKLRTLWLLAKDEELSTKQIADRMLISKNAVVGKAYRLGLPPRPSPILRAAIQHPPRPGHRYPIKGSTLPPLTAMEPPMPEPPKPVPVIAARAAPAAPRPAPAPRKSALPPSPHRTCQWIENDRKPWLFSCGEKVRPGSSYCPAHHRTVWRMTVDLRTDRWAS